MLKQIFSAGTMILVFNPLSLPVGWFQPKVLSATTATYSFSHDGGTLIAGIDSWTLSLQNGEPGDRLTIKAWKNGVPVKNGKEMNICRVRRNQTSCSKTAKSPVSDVGAWVEKVYINGVEKGTITATVILEGDPSTAGMSFFFSHHNEKIMATQHSWVFTANGLKAGDTVYLRRWKNGQSQSDIKLCSVPKKPAESSSCSATGKFRDKDAGQWEAAVIVQRRLATRTAKVTAANRGAIKYEVTKFVRPLACAAPADDDEPYTTRARISGPQKGLTYSWLFPADCGITKRHSSGQWMEVTCGHEKQYLFTATEGASGRTAFCTFKAGE